MQTLAMDWLKSAWAWRAVANAVAHEPWWRLTKTIDFFVFGFEKNERTNIDADELAVLQDLASELLLRSGDELAIAVVDGALKEICHEH